MSISDERLAEIATTSQDELPRGSTIGLALSSLQRDSVVSHATQPACEGA